MSSNYIKVTVCPGLNLRPSISFVDRMRVEADGRQLTEDVERKLTMVLAKKVFAPQIEYIEWEINRLAEMPYNIGTFYEAEEFFRRIIADYDASHNFIYTPGEKTGMVLKMKWVEGSHYWESSIRILEKLYPELLEKKLQSWLDEYFKDFL